MAALTEVQREERIAAVVARAEAREAPGDVPLDTFSREYYRQVDLEDLGPSHFRMSLNETYGCPSYFRGAIQAAMTHARARDLQVVIQNATASVVSLDVRWRQDGRVTRGEIAAVPRA